MHHQLKEDKTDYACLSMYILQPSDGYYRLVHCAVHQLKEDKTENGDHMKATKREKIIKKVCQQSQHEIILPNDGSVDLILFD